MKHALLLLIPLLLIDGKPNVEKGARVGFESIRTEDLKKYLTYLASDELAGRETSYPGEKLAAQYIADHFKSLGLTPVGDSGSYLQGYDVEVVRISEESKIRVSVPSGTETYSWLSDFLGFTARDTSVGGAVAVAGYMDSRTPESEKGKLAGKVVIAFAGQRPGARDSAAGRGPRALFFGGRRDSGVVATLIVLDDTGSSSYASMTSMVSGSGILRGRMSLKGEPPRQGRQGPLNFFISPALAGALLKAGGLSLGELREKASGDSLFSPVVLENTRISIESKVVREVRRAENVVGLLEGADPSLKGAAVVFSAHFDHIGVGAGGAIFHGADDDGSGTAMVMELAQAFAENPVKPKCSILFLAVSGEEKGLLGSGYYTTHPIIPLEQTVADFNTDMIGRIDPKHEAENDGPYSYLIGADKISTELDSIIRVANDESNRLRFDYTYNDDRDPNQFYRRSDHYNFARKGVPVAFFFTGEHADYHKTSDTVDKIHFDRMVEIGQVIYYAGWKTANAGRMLSKNGTGTTN